MRESAATYIGTDMNQVSNDISIFANLILFDIEKGADFLPFIPFTRKYIGMRLSQE